MLPQNNILVPAYPYLTYLGMGWWCQCKHATVTYSLQQDRGGRWAVVCLTSSTFLSSSRMFVYDMQQLLRRRIWKIEAIPRRPRFEFMLRESVRRCGGTHCSVAHVCHHTGDINILEVRHSFERRTSSSSSNNSQLGLTEQLCFNRCGYVDLPQIPIWYKCSN